MLELLQDYGEFDLKDEVGMERLCRQLDVRVATSLSKNSI